MAVATQQHRAFRSFRHRNARTFFVGLMFSNIGTWMQMTATSWLVHEQTDSSTVLGLVVTCQFIPLLLFTPAAGALADRRDRLSVTLLCQYGLAVQAITLTVLAFTDLASVPVVAVISLVLGTLNAFENPARRGLVTELVDPSEASNALALNSAVMTLARVFGPALAGIVIAQAGTQWCFAFNAVSYVAIVGSLRRLDRSALSPVTRAVPGGKPGREALAYVAREPTLRLVLLFITVLGMFTFNYQVALPVLVEDTFNAGPEAFGWLLTILSLGSVAGALLVARLHRPTVGVMLALSMVLGASSILVGVSPSLPVAYLAAVPLGLGGSGLMAAAAGLLTDHAPTEYRSRMLGFQMMAFNGTTPVGGPVTGQVGDTFGPRWAVAYGGVVAIVGALLAGVRRRFDARSDSTSKAAVRAR